MTCDYFFTSVLVGQCVVGVVKYIYFSSPPGEALNFSRGCNCYYYTVSVIPVTSASFRKKGCFFSDDDIVRNQESITTKEKYIFRA